MKRIDNIKWQFVMLKAMLIAKKQFPELSWRAIASATYCNIGNNAKFKKDKDINQ